jgi:hypothetical protein
MYVGNAASPATTAAARYVPRGRNELHTIFDRHFSDFCDRYDEKFATTFSSSSRTMKFNTHIRTGKIFFINLVARMDNY